MPHSLTVSSNSFHDCLHYADPAAGAVSGCDGCLNWAGVGHRFPNQTELKYKVPTQYYLYFVMYYL